MISGNKLSKSVSNEETRVWRNWSDLPNEILLQISDNLADEPFELRRFRAVCQSWRSLIKPPSRPVFTPILPIPNFSKEDKKKGRWKTCRLFESTLYTVQPLARTTASSSSKPWIIKLEEETLRGSCDQDLPNCFHLVDPLSQHLLVYPSFPETLDLFQYQIREFCKKYVLVRSYSDYTRGDKNMQIYVPGVFVTSFSHTTKHDDDFVVMGLRSNNGAEIFFREIIVYRESCHKWHTIKAKEDVLFSDIVYYKEQFLVVDWDGKISAFDPITRNATLVAYPLEKSLAHIEFEDYEVDGEPHLLYEDYKDDIRLVESNGELFLIDIYSWIQNNKNVFHWSFPFPVENCRVFKLDEVQKQWTPVHNLGDRVFLVGLQCSYSLLASDFPEGKRNCIYFTEQCIFNPRGEFRHKMGVFDLEKGIFERIKSDNYKKMFWPLPAWIQASDP